VAAALDALRHGAGRAARGSEVLAPAAIHR